MPFGYGFGFGLAKASGFNPLSLNPALWLADTGSNAAQWDDLSGNGRHLTQADGAVQPAIIPGVLNGRQVRRFNGSNAWLSRSAAFLQSVASLSLIAVFRTNGASGGTLGVVCSAGLDSAFANDILLTSSGFLNDSALFQANNDADGGASIAISPNQWTVLSAALNQPGANPLGIFNATLGTAASVATPAPATTSANLGIFEVGRYSAAPANLLNGDIAELLIFTAALNEIDRRTVERYLALKYALPNL